MRLLVVMMCLPWPPRTGSTVTAFHQIRELGKRHAIHLLCRHGATEIGDLRNATEIVEFIDAPRPARGIVAAARQWWYSLWGVPAQVSKYDSERMRQRVHELLDQNVHDALLLYEIGAIRYLPKSAMPLTVVNIEDAQSIRAWRMRQLPIWSKWRRAQQAVHAWVMQRYERRMLPRMGKVLLLSEADVVDMAASGHHMNLGHVHYGVSPVAVDDRPSFEQRDAAAIIISGNMYHLPNVDGVLHFLAKTFPIILRKAPTARLWIVGKRPAAAVRRTAERYGERVIVTGRVDDVSTYLRRSRVSVCPVRLKIGVQTKILEALSSGTPVVTTRSGNHGIQGHSGVELWVADEPEEIALRVVSLLRGDGWQEMSEAGARLVAKQHSWKLSAARLEEHIASLSV